MTRFVIAIIILGIVLWIFRDRLFEAFSTMEAFKVVPYNSEMPVINPDDKPWHRHDVYDSLPFDPQAKYTQGYYNELDNYSFELALRKTFPYEDEYGKMWLLSQQWKDIPIEILESDNKITDAYNAFLTSFMDIIKNSEHFGQTSKPLQVIHDRLRYAYTGPNDFIALKIEAILYRESKMHGKHVGIITLCKQVKDQNSDTMHWEHHVVSIEVLGVVMEDTFALHPVARNDPIYVHEYPATTFFLDIINKSAMDKSAQPDPNACKSLWSQMQACVQRTRSKAKCANEEKAYNDCASKSFSLDLSKDEYIDNIVQKQQKALAIDQAVDAIVSVNAG